jgi:hypothetical protein
MNGDEMMVAEVETSGAFSVRALRSLFAFPQLSTIRGGERPMELNVVVNWLEELEPLPAPP